MNDIQYNQGSGTFSQVLLIGLGIVIGSHGIQDAPLTNVTVQHNKPLFQKPYSLDGNVPTYNSYTGITGEYVSIPNGFEQAVGSFYARLLISQEPLGAEFEKVLYENLWDLYES